MESTEFSQIRQYLGKSQIQLARLLGISPKTVQSFEQGWRTIPAYAERQLLFLLYLKRPKKNLKPCWEKKNCNPAERRKCPAFEFRAESICWFINGTICEGKVQDDWKAKIQICRKCEVFKSLIPVLT
jgi:DNA-binding XRE family transcriptional regulator